MMVNHILISIYYYFQSHLNHLYFARCCVKLTLLLNKYTKCYIGSEHVCVPPAAGSLCI